MPLDNEEIPLLPQSHRLWDIVELVEQILVYIVRSPSFSPTLLYCQRDMTNPWEGSRLPLQLLVCKSWYLLGQRLELATHQWSIDQRASRPIDRIMDAQRLVMTWPTSESGLAGLEDGPMLWTLKKLNDTADTSPGTRWNTRELYLLPKPSPDTALLRRTTLLLSNMLEHSPKLFTNLTLLSLTSCGTNGLDLSLLFPRAASEHPCYLRNLRHLFLEDIFVAFYPDWMTEIEPPPLRSLVLSRVYIPDNLLNPFFALFCTPALERFRFIKHQSSRFFQQFPDIPGIPHKVLETLSERCPRLESIEVLLNREPLPLRKVLPDAYSRLHRLFPSASLIGINFRSVIETSVYHFDTWMTCLDVQTSSGDQQLSLSLVHAFLCSEHAVNLRHLKLPPAFIPVEWFDPELDPEHMRWTCSRLRSLDIGIRDDHAYKTKVRHTRNIFGFLVTHFRLLEVLKLHRPLMSDSVNNGMCFLSRLPHLHSFTLWANSFRLPVGTSSNGNNNHGDDDEDGGRSSPSCFTLLRRRLFPATDSLKDVRWMSREPTATEMRKAYSSLGYCRRVAKLDPKQGHFGQSPQAKALLWGEKHKQSDMKNDIAVTATTTTTPDVSDAQDWLYPGALWKDIHWFILACPPLSDRELKEERSKAVAISELVPGLQVMTLRRSAHHRQPLL